MDSNIWILVKLGLRPLPSFGGILGRYVAINLVPSLSQFVCLNDFGRGGQ